MIPDFEGFLEFPVLGCLNENSRMSILDTTESKSCCDGGVVATGFLLLEQPK